MAVNLGTIYAKLKLSTGDFVKKMDSVQERMDAVAKRSKKVAKAAGLMSAALGGVTIAAVKTAADFEKSMVRVGAVSRTLGTGAFTMLKDSALDMAAKTKYTARQVSEGMQFMAMAGMDASKIIGGMPSVLQLAAAGAMDLGSAANIVTNIMAGFGKTASELGKVNDQLVATFTNTNVDVQQLGHSFKMVGPIAASAGIKFEQMSAMIGLLGNAGIQGTMAGRTLRQAITRLINPPAEAADALARLGVRTKDSSGRLLGMDKILRQLEPHANDTAAMLAIFGQIAGPGMTALLSQGAGSLDELTQKIRESGGLAKKIADAELNTFDGQLKILGSQVEALAIEFGNALLPVLKDLIRGLQDALTWYKGLNAETKESIAKTIAATAAIAGLVAGLAMLAPALSGIAAVAPELGVVAGAIGTIADQVYRLVNLVEDFSWGDLGGYLGASLTMPFGGGLLAAMLPGGIGSSDSEEPKAAMFGWFKDSFDELTSKTADTGKALGGLSKMLESVGATTGPLGLLKKAVDDAAKSFDKSTKKRKVAAAAKSGAGYTIETLESEVRVWKAAAERMEAAAIKAFEESVDAEYIGDEVSQAFGPEISQVAKELGIDLRSAGQKISDTFGSFADSFGSAFIGATDGLSDIISGAQQGAEAGGPWGAVVGIILALAQRTEAFASAVEMVNGTIDQAVEMLNTFLTPIVTMARAMTSMAMDVIGKIFESLLKPIGKLLATIGKLTYGIIQASYLGGWLGDALELFGKVIGGVVGIIDHVLRGITSIFNKIIDFFAGLLDEMGFEGTAKRLRRRKIDIRAADAAVSEPPTELSDDLPDAAGDAADALNGLTDSLLNAPEVFKVARYRAQAADAEGAAFGGLTSGGAAGAVNINIYANDVQSAADAIAEELERRNVASRGTSTNVISPFGVSTGGA